MFSQCLSGHSGYISVRTSSSISGLRCTKNFGWVWHMGKYRLRFDKAYCPTGTRSVWYTNEKSSNKSVINSKLANQLHHQHQHKQLSKRFAGLYSITKTCYVALFLKVKKEFS